MPKRRQPKLVPIESINIRGKVLESAAQAVLTSRQLAYGAPENNFHNIAIMWNAYLEIRANCGKARNEAISAVDVAHFQDLLKTARLVGNQAHFDSWSDKAGYAACGAEVAGAKS